MVGRLTVSEVGDTHPGAPHYRAANALRGVLVRGAASLGGEDRALFSGLLIGDDRDRSPRTADDFRGAGLTHLLAVSGQNVAFVLLLVQPLAVRLGLWGRWLMILAVLGLFATVTRFEPSVLRATAMAGLAVSVWLAGRQVSGRRILALAVAGLVLAQPLLVHSLAFRLSVAASAGILFWAPSLAERIAGPRPLAKALAVTAAAQLAVAPLVIPVFGGVPVAVSRAEAFRVKTGRCCCPMPTRATSPGSGSSRTSASFATTTTPMRTARRGALPRARGQRCCRECACGLTGHTPC